jgi:flagellar hook protein FlgE
MASFYTPLSGLNADSTALNTIADNLSNMSTTAFKAQTTNFSDLFYQQVATQGSGDAIQVGGGVKVASNSVDFTQGSYDTSGTTSSDVALDGNGFFVVNNGGTNLLTRDGTFTQAANGNLVTAGGLDVMGYPALKGVVNTSGTLTPISIPVTGDVQQPQATTTFGMTANLDSTAAIGATVTGQVGVYDSLGNSYQATVNYTKIGTNQWSYSISLPDTLSAAPATPAAAATIPLTADAPVATSVTAITAAAVPTTTVPNPVSAAAPVTTQMTPVLSPAAAVPATVTNDSVVAQPGSPAGTFIYNFPTSNGAVATVNPSSTAFTLSGLDAGGNPVSTPPVVFTYGGGSAPETVADYVTDLQTALTGSGIVGVTLTSPAPGQISIVGPASLTTSNSLAQDFTGNSISYNFATSNGAMATVDPATTITINAQNTSGAVVPVTVTANPAGETVQQFASDIRGALATANITGVAVSPGTNGKITLTGPTTMTIGNATNVVQDFTGQTTNYTFGTYTDPATGKSTLAQVDPSTSLTITAKNTSGVSTPVVIAANPAGETVLKYAADISAQLNSNGITGVSVSGAGGVLSFSGPSGMTIAGNVNQDILGTTIASSVTATTPVAAAATPPLIAAAPVQATSTNPAVTMVSDSTTTPGTTVDTYSFAPTGLLDAGTNLGITIAASTYSITPTAGEAVSAYASALNALTSGHGVTVVGNDVTKSLTITGATGNFAVSNSIKQDVAMATTNYNFVTSNGAVASVDPNTTLNITEGALGPVSAPAFTSSQSVSSYATALSSALTSAGINDVTVQANNGQLSITGPANMAINGKVTQDFTGTQSNYDFGSYTDPNTGLTTQATVGPTTSLTISGPTTSGGSTTITVTPTNPAGESVSQYASEIQSQLTAHKITGITVTASKGVLSIVGPDTATIAGTVSQNMLGTTSNYSFETNATVDPTTNLTIAGQTASGTTATITAPAVSTGETVAQYATALNSALSAAGIANVQVSSTNGQLTIAGANVTLSGAVKQGLADTTINYDFGPSATVNQLTSLTIVGPTVSGTPPTAITAPPTVTPGETVAQYAAALNNELTKAGINTGPDGVSVTALGGKLSIVGPAATLKTAGTASQDLTATTISYSFGSSAGQIATVDPGSNLTISGLTTTGATATTIAPTVTAGMTLTSYATVLTNALTAAGITGTTVSATAAGQLSIVGANISTSGSLIQDPVASANAAGDLTFNSSGTLVSPAANVSGISFTGLSDGASPLSMTWDLLGSSGTSTIGQVAGTSSVTAPTQNGYPSGAYQGFAIGSDGTVTASYSNGQTQAVGQLALANVTNLQGLALQGSGDYATTTASGAASIGVSGTDGLGTIKDSALEMSNVNISAEFSNLIIAQRAFEANSKAITTFDTITQETINMIH